MAVAIGGAVGVQVGVLVEVGVMVLDGVGVGVPVCVGVATPGRPFLGTRVIGLVGVAVAVAAAGTTAGGVCAQMGVGKVRARPTLSARAMSTNTRITACLKQRPRNASTRPFTPPGPLSRLTSQEAKATNATRVENCQAQKSSMLITTVSGGNAGCCFRAYRSAGAFFRLIRRNWPPAGGPGLALAQWSQQTARYDHSSRIRARRGQAASRHTWGVSAVAARLA